MKGQILAILTDHLGKGNAIPVADIVRTLGMSQEALTNPTARMAIKELITVDKVPIGSCSAGYYIINSHEELEENCLGLYSRICGIQNRIKSLKAAYRNLCQKSHTTS